MKLKEALELREPIEKKEKSGKMNLKEALELRKAKKYIKRTGSPGNYKYVYKITHPGEDTKRFGEAAAKVRKEIEKQKEKKPVSSKKYMKEHAGDIRREADELKRMSDEDFKRKKEKYDKEKKGKLSAENEKGLSKWLNDWNSAKGYGNEKLANEIKNNIEKKLIGTGYTFKSFKKYMMNKRSERKTFNPKTIKRV